MVDVGHPGEHTHAGADYPILPGAVMVVTSDRDGGVAARDAGGAHPNTAYRQVAVLWRR